MRKLKKVIAISMVFGMVSFLSFAVADTFDYSDDLFRRIEDSVNTSNIVRSKRAGEERTRHLLNICEERIEFLDKIITGKIPGDFRVVINTYSQRFSIRGFEIDQLRRSETMRELVVNARAIKTVYERLKSEVIKSAPSGFSFSSSSREETTSSETGRRFMSTRENRKGYQGGGRSKRK